MSRIMGDKGWETQTYSQTVTKNASTVSVDALFVTKIRLRSSVFKNILIFPTDLNDCWVTLGLLWVSFFRDISKTRGKNRKKNHRKLQ